MHYKQIENSAIITKLPSGFYAVWIGGDWINASLPSEESATDWLSKYLKKRATA